MNKVVLEKGSSREFSAKRSHTGWLQFFVDKEIGWGEKRRTRTEMVGEVRVGSPGFRDLVAMMEEMIEEDVGLSKS